MRHPKADLKLDKLRTLAEPYEIQRAQLTLVVLPNVYPTSEVSELVAECLEEAHFGATGARVLDYGTGTGFLALCAAQRGAAVVATDINPAAVACARLNAARYNLSATIDVRLGRELESISSDERFDVVVGGLPWDDADVSDMLDRAMYDSGFRMRDALLSNARRLLTPNGRILLTYAAFAERRNPLANNAYGLTVEIVRERVISGELHYVVSVTP